MRSSVSLAWRIEFSEAARKTLERLDRQVARRILSFLEERVAVAERPRDLAKPLAGTTLGNLWRFRVGDYRIIADLQDAVLTVLVVRIGHRSDVYR